MIVNGSSSHPVWDVYMHPTFHRKVYTPEKGQRVISPPFSSPYFSRAMCGKPGHFHSMVHKIILPSTCAAETYTPQKINGWGWNLHKFPPQKEIWENHRILNLQRLWVLSPSQPPPRGALKRRPKQSSFPRACKNGSTRSNGFLWKLQPRNRSSFFCWRL